MTKDYIIAELRCALLRTKLAIADLTAIGIALSEDRITPEEAADAAREVNCLHLGAPVALIDPGPWALPAVADPE